MKHQHPYRFHCAACNRSYNPSTRCDAPICDHGRCPLCHDLLIPVVHISGRDRLEIWVMLGFFVVCLGCMILIALVRLIGGAP